MYFLDLPLLSESEDEDGDVEEQKIEEVESPDPQTSSRKCKIWTILSVG